MQLQKTKVTLFISLFLFCNLVFAASSPLTTMQNIASQLLTYLHRHKSQLRGNIKLIHRIVNKVLVPHIAANRMAGSVVGRRYWMAASATQRSIFIKEFKQLVINTYSNALASYNDDKMRFYPLRSGYAGRKTIQIKSILVRKNGQRILIIYNMALTGGQWKVYDFSIEGISILQSYRSQFAGVLAQGGMAALIQKLKTYNQGH